MEDIPSSSSFTPTTKTGVISSREEKVNSLKDNNYFLCWSRSSSNIGKSDASGFSVVANRDLKVGDEVLSCRAEGVALDNPYRHSHCAYCCINSCE
jgi:hypothetical protein